MNHATINNKLILLVLRTVSNYTMPAEGISAADNLTKHGKIIVV